MMRKHATRPEQLARSKEHFLRFVKPGVKRVLIAGNSRGQLLCAVHTHAPKARILNISTAMADVQEVRDLIDRKFPSSEEMLGARVSGLQLHREVNPEPYDLIVFHPHLQVEAGDEDKLLPAILRACTNLHQMLASQGTLLVLALNPRAHLSVSYRENLRSAFLTGFCALGMRVERCSTEKLELRNQARTDHSQFDEEQALVFTSYVLIVARKQ